MERLGRSRISFEREVIVYVAGKRVVCRAESLDTDRIALRSPIRVAAQTVVRVNITFSGGQSMAIDGLVLHEQPGRAPYLWDVRFRRMAFGLRQRLETLIGGEAAKSRHRTGPEHPSVGGGVSERVTEGHVTRRRGMTGPEHPSVGDNASERITEGHVARRRGMTGPEHPSVAGSSRTRWEVSLTDPPSEPVVPPRAPAKRAVASGREDDGSSPSDLDGVIAQEMERIYLEALAAMDEPSSSDEGEMSRGPRAPKKDGRS